MARSTVKLRSPHDAARTPPPPKYQLFTPYGLQDIGGHGGRVVTLSPPTSEAGVRFLARPQVGKLVVACRWSAVYSTEP